METGKKNAFLKRMRRRGIKNSFNRIMNVITGNIVMFMMFPVLVLEGGMEMESHEEKIGSAGGRRTGHEDRAWLFFNIGWSVIYLLWRGFRTLPLGQGPISAAAGIALLTVEILGMLEALVYYFNMYHMESHEVPEVLPEEYPDVDVFIATYNEPPELLYKTINGCLHMEYPDKEKVHIYLCDDGKRPEMRALAEQMGIHYLDREERRGAKAGNLNHAMSVTGSPLIATFDADMVPKSNFLLVTAAYFVDREKKNRELEEKDRIKLGFIQTPQSFYNLDLFQFNLFSEKWIPNEQDYFYKDVQVSRNKSNSVIYGGSNTLLSREALEAAGGFYTDSITEDFATGILIQKKGYVCYAISTVLASGLSPTDLKSLVNQRIRWARGCIQTGRKMHLVFSRHLSFPQKANYLASVWYWYAPWKRLVYIMSPILFAVFHVTVVKCTLMEMLVFWLPMYISSNICLKKLSHNIRTAAWTNLYETAIFPFLLLPVLAETLGIKMKKFKVTKKDGAEKEGRRIWHAVPHLALTVLSVHGMVNCIRWMFHTGRLDYLIILFWLLVNLYHLVMSLFFLLGRKSRRQAERQDVAVDCLVRAGQEEEKGKTLDISENSVSVLLPRAMPLEKGEGAELVLDDGKYRAVVAGKIILAEYREPQWRYVFLVTDWQQGKGEYMQIIYDRNPSWPVNLDESVSSFEELRINLGRRIYAYNYVSNHGNRVRDDRGPVLENMGNGGGWEGSVGASDIVKKRLKPEDEISEWDYL